MHTYFSKESHSSPIGSTLLIFGLDLSSKYSYLYNCDEAADHTDKNKKFQINY